MVSWFKALRKTRDVFSSVLQGVISDGAALDELTLEELEIALIRADLPPRLVAELINDLEENQLHGKRKATDVLRAGLRKRLNTLDHDPFDLLPKPCCILLLGVNGAGKTTTCAKLAHRAAAMNRKVLLGAADTFRAAGTDQLRLWSERINVPVVSGRQGSDAAAVAFDALDAAYARGAELLFIDTAGRMHTKSHLMEELRKMVRALQKRDPAAPHQTWMILDGSLGQNSLNQAVIFHEAVPLTGLVITKLDGSSKAGFLFNIQQQLPNVPVLFTGLGEQAADLVRFDADAFVDSLLKPSGSDES